MVKLKQMFETMDYLLFIFCVIAFQIPSIPSLPTPLIVLTTEDSDISSSLNSSSTPSSSSAAATATNISATSLPTSSLSPSADSTSSTPKELTSAKQSSTLSAKPTIESTIVTSVNSATSLSTKAILASNSSSISTIIANTPATTTQFTVSKADLKTPNPHGTLPGTSTTKPDLVNNPMVVGNLQQNSSFSQDITEANANVTENITDDVLRNGTNTTDSTFEQTTPSTTTITTATTTTDNSKMTTHEDFYNDTSIPMSTSTKDTVTSHAVSSSAASSAESSVFNNYTIMTKRTASALTTQKNVPTSTHSSNGDKSKQSPTSCDEKGQDSAFGEYGLAVSTVALALCVVLFIVILVMMARASKQKKARRMSADDKSTPKLQMLEIKDDATKRSTHDDLHVYSLDYEKHVQEKIEEHKKKTRPPVADKPIGGITTFMLNKKPSVRSTASSPSSPGSLSPMSPAEQKPLLKKHDDEPVIFNFAKRPSELLTKRRGSALDDAGRRKSNASTGKSAKSEGFKDRFDDIDV